MNKNTASVSCPLDQQMHQDYNLLLCAILKKNRTYFLHKIYALLITLTTTQSQSLRQTKFISIKISFYMVAAPLSMTLFSPVATLTKSSFTLNAPVQFFSNIQSASDSTNVTFSKLESNMLAMTSPKRETAPLNHNLTLSKTVYYPLQGNLYSTSLG